MSKFKIGDKVVRTTFYEDDEKLFMKKGGVYTVSEVFPIIRAIRVTGSDLIYDGDYFELVEEATTSAPKNMKCIFKNMKFRVESEEHSKLIQDELFKLGFSWFGGNQTHQHTSAKGIFTGENGEKSLTWTSDSVWVEEHANTEYKLEEIKSYKLVPVEKAETIMIDGKEYKKADVLERLAALTPLN
jgi:hypothetical protein